MRTFSPSAHCALRIFSGRRTTLRRVARLLAAALLLAILLPRTAAAATYYWAGGTSGNGNWDTDNGGATNWSSSASFVNDPGSIPGSADNVFFFNFGTSTDSFSVDLGGENQSINSLTFLSGLSPTATATISSTGGYSLTLGSGGLTDDQGNGAVTLSSGVVLGAAQTWSNYSSGSAVSVSGVISGALSNNITFIGTGGFNLSGANTYTGTTTVGVGVGNSLSGSPLGSTTLTLSGANGSLASSAITVNNGATLTLDNTAANPFAMSGRIADTATIALNGATFNLLGNGSAPSAETVGTLSLGTGASQINVTPAGSQTAALTFGSASLASISRSIGGTVNFSNTTNGTIILPDVTLSNSIIGGYATIGDLSGGSTINWATTNGSNQVVAYTGYTAPTLSGTNNSTANAQLSGTQAISASGSVNSLYLTGGGNLTFTGGTLTIGSGGIISNGGTQTVAAGGNQPAITGATLIGAFSAAGTGSITTTSPDLVVVAAGNMEINAVISGSIGLTKTGAGLLDLGNENTGTITNTYTGVTTIDQGVLKVKSNLNLSNNTIIFNGGILRTSSGFTFSSNQHIQVDAGGGTLEYVGGSVWTFSQSTPPSGPGSITYYSDPTANTGTAENQTINLDTSTTPTYQGSTTLEMNASAANTDTAPIQLQLANQIPAKSALIVLNAATAASGSSLVNLDGTTQSVGSLSGNGNIENTTGTFSLTIGNDNTNQTYGTSSQYTANNGIISGTGSITKVGTGTETFTTNNTYTGATNINAGALVINGSPTGTGAFTVGTGVAPDALATLAGSGTIAAPVTVNSLGHLSPDNGAGSTKTLTINNNLTVSGGSILDFDFGATIGNTASFSPSDVVKVTGSGTLAINNASTNVTINITPLSGFGAGVYDLLDASGSTGTLSLASTTDFTINASNTNLLYNVVAPGQTVNGYTNSSTKDLELLVTTNPISLVTWTGSAGSGGNATWDTTSANWSPSTYADGDRVVFNSAGTNTNISLGGATFSPNSLTFNNNAGTPYTFSNGTIAGSATLVKTQGGTVTFNNANTFSGNTTISGGTVAIGSTGTYASPNITVSGSGSLFSSAGSIAPTTNLTLNTGGAATFSSASQTIATLGGDGTGTLTLNGTALTLSGSNAVPLVAGSGSLRITSGTLTFTNSGNTYTGGTFASGGATIVVAVGSDLGTPPATPTTNITLNGATLQIPAETTNPTQTINPDRSIFIGSSGATINIPNAASGTFAGGETAVEYTGLISGGANSGTSLTISGGSGTNSTANCYLLELGGQSIYTGNTTISNAAVSFFNSGNGGTGPANILPTTTVLTLQTNGWFVLNNGASTQQLAGLIGDTTAEIGCVNTGTAANLTIAPTAGNTYLFQGVVGPIAMPGKTGLAPTTTLTIGAGGSTGTEVLSGTNTYTGATTISSGTLQLGGGGTTGSLAGGSAISIAGGATLAIDRSNAATQGTDFSSASITGGGTLEQIGSGTTTLNVANGYSGGTTVNSGTLTGAVAGGFGSGYVTVNPTGTSMSSADNATLNTTGSIAATATLTVNSETSDGVGNGIGTVNFNGTAPQIGALNGNGLVVLNGSTGTTLTVGNASNNLSSTFSGTIRNGAGRQPWPPPAVAR